jgi:hypothetical protein
VRVRRGLRRPSTSASSANPHPSPLPEYRAREKDEYGARE